MGVLKVSAEGLWRHIGCGGHPASSVVPITYFVLSDTTDPFAPVKMYERRDGVVLVNTIGAVWSGSDALGGSFSLEIHYNTAGFYGFGYGLLDPTTLSGVGSGGAAGGGGFPFNGSLTGTWPTDPATIDVEATVGRLKLWTGTEWVVEACDGDTGGHPLKLWAGSAWVVVACMVPIPAGGLYDTGMYDTAVYG